MKKIAMITALLLGPSFSAFAGGGPSSCLMNTISEAEARTALSASLADLGRNGFNEYLSDGYAYHCKNGWTVALKNSSGQVAIVDAYNEVDGKTVLTKETFASCADINFEHTNRWDQSILRQKCQAAK
jgi:hypothetical protein